MNRNSLLVSEESWSRWRGDSIELMLSISRVRHWDLYWIMSQYFYVFREFLQVTTRGAFHIIVPGTVLQLNVQCSEIELTTNENWTQHRSGVLSLLSWYRSLGTWYLFWRTCERSQYSADWFQLRKICAEKSEASEIFWLILTYPRIEKTWKRRDHTLSIWWF